MKVEICEEMKEKLLEQDELDIDNELIRTRSGAGIGDTESLIYELFGEKIETKIRRGGRVIRNFRRNKKIENRSYKYLSA